MDWRIDKRMATKIKFAVWFRDGKLFRVRPPRWPKNTELSFTDQTAMIEWALGARLMLKDGNKRRASA
jgi:hypothetical protein